VVGADGKTSAARRWIGGESMADPEHHRFGGVLLAGLKADPSVFYDVTRPEVATFSFAAGPDAHRLYLRLTAEQVREIGADRSLEAFVAHAARFLPEGMLDEAEQVGPFGFFPNSDTWASRIANDAMVLIGDAAGSADPALGHGTSLLFRDVRELSDLLLSERDWPAATGEFARRRDACYQAVRAYDRWNATVLAETGDEADHRRERHARAREQDPTLGGFGALEEWGPDGLIPDEAARRHFFGEDLA
jgi:2-polyprenyl-6-methoxyphenol hydroxylase-like FAD-dependent oxidoreductase